MASVWCLFRTSDTVCYTGEMVGRLINDDDTIDCVYCFEMRMRQEGGGLNCASLTKIALTEPFAAIED